MDARPSLQIRADQRMALLPQMLQSIEILQLAAVDLVARVAEECERNEALELAHELDGVEWPQPERKRAADDDDSWRPARPTGDVDGKIAFLANIEDSTEDLLEFVSQQLAWRGYDEELREAIWLLAQHLDERGLLLMSDEELDRLLPAGLGARALAGLQGLEPRGLGARSTAEALLLQIDADDPDREDLVAILGQHLPALARNKIPEVAKALDLTPEDVEALLGRLRRLETRPAAQFRSVAAEALRPDATVEFGIDGAVEVRVDDGPVPALTVNTEYAAMARDRGTDADVRRYIADKVRTARDLISAVAHRKLTLARVVGAVMEQQGAFLAHGRSAVQPLKMADVGERLGLHPSTVSRAIAGKSVQTPHGVLMLRDFFDGGDSRSGAVGRLGVKQRLQELVAAENPEQPLSDDELVSQLAKGGIKVARRTVTKYRKELSIPASWQRKRYGNR